MKRVLLSIALWTLWAAWGCGASTDNECECDSANQPCHCADSGDCSHAHTADVVADSGGDWAVDITTDVVIPPDLEPGDLGDEVEELVGDIEEEILPEDLLEDLCVPQCMGKECGDDGCGGVCGNCPAAAPFCVDGICGPSCIPACDGKECGPDGCGSICGCCPAEAPHCVDGACSVLCQPMCEGKECGDDGCGGQCGKCPAVAPLCVDGLCSLVCLPDCVGKDCGDDGCGGECGECPIEAPLCSEGQCVAPCVPDCDGKQCGNDGCGGECGQCPIEAPLCFEGHCVVPCVPYCDGKQCGNDGCGGECGQCQTHYACEAGACVYVPWCGDGVCDDDESCLDCIDCACECGHECIAGSCTFVACAGLDCGDDGCGGSCGSCSGLKECNESGMCICPEPFGGDECNTCAAGYYSFPLCTKNCVVFQEQPSCDGTYGAASFQDPTFFGGFSDAFSADDFTVPPGMTLDITSIFVAGHTWNPNAPYGEQQGIDNVSSIVIEIYPDVDGMPAAYPTQGVEPLVKRTYSPSDTEHVATFTVSSAVNDSFQIWFESPISLGPGTYWMWVYVIHSYLDNGEWGWVTIDTPHGATAKWISPRYDCCDHGKVVIDLPVIAGGAPSFAFTLFTGEGCEVAPVP